MDKVISEYLPETREGIGAKRWTENRGEFVQIAYAEPLQHLAIFEIRKGFSRGGHYHKQKEEIFYIAKGKIEAKFIDMETLKRYDGYFTKGEKLRIKPLCGHLFTAVEDSLIVEYSPQIYDPEDTHPVAV